MRFAWARLTYVLVCGMLMKRRFEGVADEEAKVKGKVHIDDYCYDLADIRLLLDLVLSCSKRADGAGTFGEGAGDDS